MFDYKSFVFYNLFFGIFINKFEAPFDISHNKNYFDIPGTFY